MLKLRRQLKLRGGSVSLFSIFVNININCPPESRKRTADRLSQEMEEEEEHSTGKCTRTISPLQDDHDHDLDEDEQALARNLPPVSTSMSRSNIILSDDDHQEEESKSILLCCCRLLGNLVD